VRGGVVIDKSFLIMALACAMAPFLGVGIYLVVNLFWGWRGGSVVWPLGRAGRALRGRPASFRQFPGLCI